MAIMVFDFNAQMKLVQSITQLTMKNMSTAVENAAAQASRSETTTTNRAIADNPFAQMMDPANWAQMMQPAPFAGSTSNPSSTMQSLWWPLNPSFLSKSQPQTMGMSSLGLPNMAIPLGLNPFGNTDTPSISLPILSAQSPLAAGNKSEWPDMFWWLVQNNDKNAPSPTDESAASAAPWAMIMDPFGLIDEPQPEPEETEPEDATQNLFEMMFDPFGLMKSDKNSTTKKTRRSVKTRRTPTTPPPTPEIFPNTVNYLDPFGFMKAQSENSVTNSTGDSRNMFFGYQPNAKHPLMNDGSPTGMFYLAIALPKDIANINPHLPPWNLAL